jgi:hypothetical protein
MRPQHGDYQFAILGWLWLCIMLHSGWPRRSTTSHRTPPALGPSQGKRKRANEPKACEGLTPRPPGAACTPDAHPRHGAPQRCPAPMPPPHRRPRVIDPSRHFCPHGGCDERGGLGRRNLRANGHPRGGPGRQGQWPSWAGACLETPGPLCHGPQASVELRGRGLAGLGMRATVRGCESAPTPVLPWLVEAAAQRRVFSASLRCDRPIHQVQLDEVSAVLRGGSAGESSAQHAIKGLERARQGGWTARAPARQRRVASALRPRPLALAQRVVHDVVQRRAPAWGPLPQLGAAQVGKSSWRRRLVAVTHRVVCGPMDTVQQVLSGRGGKDQYRFCRKAAAR